MRKHLKMQFEVVDSDGTTEIESMWVVPVENGFEIDNIPFYASDLALADVVSGRTDDGGAIWYESLLTAGGHSTLRLWLADENSVPEIRRRLSVLGCASELSNVKRLVAVDVPPVADYKVVKAFLDAEEAKGTLEYEEACLASP